MIKILLLRHGMTPGNQLGRYIGSTDEGLSEVGRSLLAEKKKLLDDGENVPELLFVSPMLRCRQTAEIFFPKVEQLEVRDFREMDFGIFENKNYQELSGNPEYQKWIDGFCEGPVPGGEEKKKFQRRVMDAFLMTLKYCEEKQVHSAAYVVHGGTIMSLMEQYAEEQKSYFDWHVKNGDGYSFDLTWKSDRKLTPVFHKPVLLSKRQDK